MWLLANLVVANGKVRAPGANLLNSRGLGARQHFPHLTHSTRSIVQNAGNTPFAAYSAYFSRNTTFAGNSAANPRNTRFKGESAQNPHFSGAKFGRGSRPRLWRTNSSKTAKCQKPTKWNRRVGAGGGLSSLFPTGGEGAHCTEAQRSQACGRANGQMQKALGARFVRSQAVGREGCRVARRGFPKAQLQDA